MERRGMIDEVSLPDPLEPGSDYLDTIALLQEEIARLEAELLARDEAEQGLVESGGPDDDAHGRSERSAELECERARLSAELSARDETISLLLDQLRLVEEAETASRAEWEQLASWVAEVEERVERQSDEGASRDAEELTALRRQCAELGDRLDQERKAWAGQRRGLDQEIERLQSLLAQGAGHGGATSDASEAIRTLEAENRRLRQCYQDIEESSRTEVQDLTGRLQTAQRQWEETRKELDAVKDERQRDRKEYDLAVASLRTQASRASLAAGKALAAGLESEESPAPELSPALEADMRIRAFRQHLKEIHTHEAETRHQNRLSTRLSRLWSRTASR